MEGWMLAHPWMVFWLAALIIICLMETAQVVAKLDERKAMHKAVLAVAEMKKLELEMECKNVNGQGN